MAGAPMDGGGRAHLRRDWTRAVALGELVGFVPPALTGASVAALGAPDAAMVLGLTLAGALEGLSVGAAQATVLRRHAPEVGRALWVRATVTGRFPKAAKALGSGTAEERRARAVLVRCRPR